MPNATLQILLMAGGEGTRFAPLSTPKFPKQFIGLTDSDRSLFQLSVDRILTQFDVESLWVTTNARYKSIIKDQTPEIPEKQAFGEPYKKNTAPGIAWVAKRCYDTDPKSILAVLPSDHHIIPANTFCATLQRASQIAEAIGAIVILGKKPTRPATEYGYIQVDKTQNPKKFFAVQQFVEKPDLAKAKNYVEAGNYFWNLGMFIFPTKLLLEEVQKHLPEIYQSLQKSKTIEEYYQDIPSISFDYGIMEKTKKALMLPAEFKWYDLGTWEGLRDLTEKENIKLPENVCHIMREQLRHTSSQTPRI